MVGPLLAGLIVERTLHAQPKVDVLLCRGQADPAQPPDAQFVVKRIHLQSPSPSGTLVKSGQAAQLEAAHEAMIIERLLQLPQRHPHVVAYHSLATQPKALLIAMEFCPRGDPLTWLQQQPGGRLAEPQALTIFAQIARGVQILHRHDIAHRDLSLENCLVAQDFSVKICDFGLAASASSLSAQHVGKVNSMAPEVVRGDLYDPVRADVWSLGIVLFVLLTGSPLFQLASPEDAAYVCIQRVGVFGVLENWGLAHLIGNDTTELLAAMLRIDAESRLRTVGDVIDRLPR